MGSRDPTDQGDISLYAVKEIHQKWNLPITVSGEGGSLGSSWQVPPSSQRLVEAPSSPLPSLSPTEEET